MVNFWVFKGDKSESEVKTNNGPRVCPLLVKGPHFTCVEHVQCPLLAHRVSTHTVLDGQSQCESIHQKPEAADYSAYPV